MTDSRRRIPPSVIKFAADEMGKLGSPYCSKRVATERIAYADSNYIEEETLERKNLVSRFMDFLNYSNRHNPDPMSVFGRLIFSMAEDVPAFRSELRERLEKLGFRYIGEGIIESSIFPSYGADYFLKILKQENADGIKREFERIERNISSDPLNAALNAAAALEASCKFYLGESNYYPKDTLKPLAEKVLKQLNFGAADSGGNLKAGLAALCAAIEIFRNKYSAAHGRGTAELCAIGEFSDAEIRLYIQTAQMLCFYILSQRLPRDQQP